VPADRAWRCTAWFSLDVYRLVRQPATEPKPGEIAQPRVAFDVAQACLAHVIGNQVHRAYDRGDRFDLRKPVMESWGLFCAGESPAEVIPFESRRPGIAA
jgi:hypothetical protein